MEYRLREGFEQKKGVISNSHGFLSTYLDGGFKEKWNGYWSPSTKYLDYFAAKVNGIWLSPENLKEVEYSDRITFWYQVSSLEVRQEVLTPEDLPGFKLRWRVHNLSESRKAVKLGLEPGIDIRSKAEDIGNQDYNVESIETGLKVFNDDKWVSMSSDELDFSGEGYIKTHFPGEKQKCFIPGEMSCKVEVGPGDEEECEVVFKTGDEVSGPKPSFDGCLKDSELSRVFNYSLESLENIFYRKNGAGVIAGHPWFQNYWARDSFWTVLGMIDAGMFEEAEEVLVNFSSCEEFPSKILTDGGLENGYPRCDSIPLFAIAVDKLDRYFDASKELVGRAEELLENERPEKKIVDHSPKGTWMDTLERGNAVDIQSLWIEALSRFDMKTNKLREGLEKFKKQGYMHDNLMNDFESINPCVSLMFGHVDDDRAREYLEKVNGEFSSRFGARTRSATDPGYDASGYHTGSVWGLTTCWAAAANLRYGNDSRGFSFLRRLGHFVDRNQLGALPEVVNAESGESLGCDEQAWSAGLFVHVVDSYLFGINVRDGKVVVDPASGFSGIRKSKKVLGTEIELKVNNGEVEILNEPGIEVEIR
jgi:hypothetical protein